MKLRLCRFVALLAGAWFSLASCSRDDGLEWRDLSAGEREFITRFIVLERARAVSLTRPQRGAALLDSLTTAWGDSANPIARQQVPAEPPRAAAIYALLGRMLAAEADSLVSAPEARRLAAPLPRPTPAAERPR